MMQSFVSLGVTTILWYSVGYSLAFSGDGLIIGNLDKAFLHGVDSKTLIGDAGLPEYVFFAYQMMFAIITPALITGAFANRIKFKAYLIFLVVWLLFVYFPFVHMVWGGGILSQWGVKDFAGGIVVHATAGMAALASVFYVGKRKVRSKGPHDIPLVAIGTGLLWFGWYGFNAGSELKLDHFTVLAFINTDIAASFAAITWLVIEWKREKQPKFVGLLTGAVAGLATITPAAGFVTTNYAAIIGISAGVVAFIAVSLKNRLGWDDALDVWGVHGVGGILGTVLLGVFGAVNGAEGLITGKTNFFFVEVLAVAIAGADAFFFTYVALAAINKVTEVKVGKAEEETGLDAVEYGEDAYLD